MNKELAALLLREVFLPGKYPYYINISSDDYSDEDIEKCMLDMEKEGLLHFWAEDGFSSISTAKQSTGWFPHSQPRVTINKTACTKFLKTLK